LTGCGVKPRKKRTSPNHNSNRRKGGNMNEQLVDIMPDGVRLIELAGIPDRAEQIHRGHAVVVLADLFDVLAVCCKVFGVEETKKLCDMVGGH
jgi:hypothetical protein